MTTHELRAVAWTQVLGPVAVGAALLALTSAGAMGGPQPEFLWLGLGALALGAGACLDDRAAAVTAACPTGRRRRTAQRLAVPAVIVAGWCVFAAAVDGVHGLSGTALALTGSGVVLAAVAASDVLRRLGTDEPGAIVGGAALLLVVVCLLFQPFGDLLVLQAYPDRGSAPALWLVGSVLAVTSLGWTTADPAGRPHPPYAATRRARSL